LNSDFVYYTWDEDHGQGRLKQIKGGTLANPTSLQSLSYTYDLVGKVMTIVDTKAGGTQTQTFGYDAADRLISASATGGSEGTYSETYAYNSTNGNLNNKGGVAQTYGTSTTSTPSPGAAGAGPMPTMPTATLITRNVDNHTYNLAYDAENHLTGAGTSTFVYDGDGNRVKATVGVTTTNISDAPIFPTSCTI
jgi:YD repeat-containing protein